MEYHGRITQKEQEENPIVSKCYAYGRTTEHFFVKDNEHPYQQDRPFDWIRAYQVGREKPALGTTSNTGSL